ncbi:hypothetical protein Emed_003854 [Eimeria media]
MEFHAFCTKRTFAQQASEQGMGHQLHEARHTHRDSSRLSRESKCPHSHNAKTPDFSENSRGTTLASLNRPPFQGEDLVNVESARKVRERGFKQAVRACHCVPYSNSWEPVGKRGSPTDPRGLEVAKTSLESLVCRVDAASSRAMQRQIIKAARLPLSAPHVSNNGEQAAACNSSPALVGSSGPLFSALIDLDALAASLRACEVAAEATQAISKRILWDALAEGVFELNADAVRACVDSLDDMALLNAMPKEAGASTLTPRTHQQASIDQHLLQHSSSLCGSGESLSQLSDEGSKLGNTQNQEGDSSIPPSFNVPSFSPQSHDSNLWEHTKTCISTRGRKRRRDTESSTTGCPEHNLDPASNRLHEEECAHGCKDFAAAALSSLVKPSPGSSGDNAFEQFSVSKKRRGPAKQSRMSRRLESFRREAEEALRGQQNAVVMSIFSLIDGQTRRLRGGSMTASELDMRIMMVIDKCLPLKGSDAKAVEAVLNMTAVRQLKASLEGVPRSSETFLDLVSLSKVCKHIPGVCFDKWNLGWIATWREDKRPVHKHFSAKKYGFFRAREFAICYRSKMTSDLPLDGATYPDSRGALLARGDLTPLLSGSTETVNETLARWQVETEGIGRARRAVNAPAARDPMLMGAALDEGREGEDRSASSANAQPGKGSLGSSVVSPASVPFLVEGAAAASRGKQQQGQAQVVHHKPEDVTEGDIFVSRDGWADLVSRTPKVERVSFDFTNQRRFAVSKYGFATAHRLAVEYKSKYFKDPQQPCASSSSPAATSNNTTGPAPFSATLGGVGQPKQQQPAAAARGCRVSHRKVLACRHPAETQDGVASSAVERGTQWGETEALSNIEEKQQPKNMQGGEERGLLSHSEEQLGPQEHTAFEGEASNSNANEREMQHLCPHTAASSPGLASAGGFSFLSGKADAVDLGALEALFCSHPEVGEMLSCSMARESAEGARGIDGTTTTATPTSHTHASVEAFPVNTVTPAVRPGSSRLEHDDGQVQTGLQQQVQQTLEELLRLSGEVKQHEQVLGSHLASSSSDLEAGLASPGNQQETSTLPGLEMQRAAIKGMLLDLAAVCMHDKSLS